MDNPFYLYFDLHQDKSTDEGYKLIKVNGIFFFTTPCYIAA